jgi:tRNA A-37 threonylcarbamoyl transferase component Bud32
MNDESMFALLDREFWVPLEQNSSTPEFRALAGQVLPDEGWTSVSQGVWTYYEPHGWSGVKQGWKLHVSATPANARTVLERVATVARDHPVAFKFASGPTILDLMLSKNWPREGGGKFITLYPPDEAAFQRLGLLLAQATEGLDGPYILSDRRVPGSRIVFYRYGEHRTGESVDALGDRIRQLEGPGGEKARDERRGWFALPTWVRDPYGSSSVKVLSDPADRPKLNGRYVMLAMIRHSNLGGIYRAHDVERDQAVVVRERRPLVGWTGPRTDAVGLLRKETRILRRMDGSGITPAYVDAFQLWEHHYLVMEAIEGMELRDFALSRYFRPGKLAGPRYLFQTFRRVILELARGIEEFHRRGIILRDLSVTNVLVRRDRSLCFVDFEYAWEKEGNGDFAPGIATPGFASPEQRAGKAPTEADDWYSLGGIVVEICSMLAPGLDLYPAGVLRAAEMMMDEVGLPHALLEVARGLLDPDPAARWRGDAVRRALADVRSSALAARVRAPGDDPGAAPPAGPGAEPRECCDALCDFFERSARPQRAALWPASPGAYDSNPVCIRTGACGPLEFVRRARGRCPDAWLDWVEERATPERCPPGLYVGLAGVALTLAAYGREAWARGTLRAAVEVPLLPEHAPLNHGAAGVGMAALALGTALDDGGLVDAAVRIGDELTRHAVKRRRGLAWPVGGANGAIPSGLTSGGAGIALFYTYLGAATGEERFWELARQALEFEFAQAVRSSGVLFWPLHAERPNDYSSPHVMFGSAGIGTAAARLYACTREPALREWAERCGDALTFRWTNKLWQDMGYAGWGETLLDLHAATGEERWRTHALRMAEAILPHRVQTRLGTAFPGGGLNRVASDYGMGASGIGLFLHRVAYGGHRAFFPDHLLPAFPATAPEAREQVSAAYAPGTSGAAAARPPAGRAPARARVRTPA